MKCRCVLHRKVVFAVVITLAGMAGPAPSYAFLIETANMGETISGVSQCGSFASNACPVITRFQFEGARFTLDHPMRITQVGGHFFGHDDGSDNSIFAAIVPLEPDGFPVDSVGDALPDLESLALASGILEAPSGMSAEVLTDVDATLEAGTYGIVFGKGLFGASPNGHPFAVGNGDGAMGVAFMQWQDDDYMWETPGFNALVNRPRFVVAGALVPEPASLSIALLVAAGMIAVCRSRSGIRPFRRMSESSLASTTTPQSQAD